MEFDILSAHSLLGMRDMKKYVILISVIALIGIFGQVSFLEAGFGVSPPHVMNYHLIRGSHFEETVYLVRGEPDVRLNAEVTLDAPEIEDWITIDKGMNFPLPKGEQKVPMKVIIDVPADAAFGNYQGYIQVRAVPGEGTEGGVATVLGVRVDIDIAVSEKGYSDFRIRGISIPDFEKGSSLVVFMMLENTGNTQIRPSKVHLDIYDISHLKLLQSGDIFETTWVEPFATRQSTGELQVDLELGEYWADVTVYKEEESLGVNRVHFRVIPKTEKPVLPEEGKEEPFLSLYFSYIGVGIILLIILLVLIWIERKKIKVAFKKRNKE